MRVTMEYLTKPSELDKSYGMNYSPKTIEFELTTIAGEYFMALCSFKYQKRWAPTAGLIELMGAEAAVRMKYAELAATNDVHWAAERLVCEQLGMTLLEKEE